jgi:hypothetical protein
MKIIAAVLGFVIGIVFFLPKENLFFELQKKLAEQNIYINTDIKETPVYLDLKNGTVYVSQMDIVRFKSCRIEPFVLWNKIGCSDINIADQYKINRISLNYSLLHPLSVIVKGAGNFGKINGKIDIIGKSGKIYITGLTNPLIKKFLKKDKKGYYYYVKF